MSGFCSKEIPGCDPNAYFYPRQDSNAEENDDFKLVSEHYIQ